MAEQLTINHTTLNNLREMLGEILPELITAFIEDGATLLEQMKNDIAASEFQPARIAAHTLKSSAKNIGADTLAEYCAQIEEGSDLSVEAMAAIQQKAAKEMELVQAILEKEL